jgi:hypothetical protein
MVKNDKEVHEREIVLVYNNPGQGMEEDGWRGCKTKAGNNVGSERSLRDLYVPCGGLVGCNCNVKDRQAGIEVAVE